jgi:hypothetical protein
MCMCTWSGDHSSRRHCSGRSSFACPVLFPCQPRVTMAADSDIAALVESSVTAAQSSLLNELGSLMDSRLYNFEQKLAVSQKTIADKQMEKLSVLGDGYKFKRVGNEEQHKHNSKLQEKILRAKNDMQEGLFEEANNELAQGLNLIAHRQKLVKLADSSELGWKVVQEYETHALAEDSDDEKRILKAEARAGQKLKDDRLKKTRKSRTFPYARFNNNAMNAGYQHQSTGSSRATSTSSLGFNPQQPSRRPGLCFACGKAGHWRQDCLGLSRATEGPGAADKLSILNKYGREYESVYGHQFGVEGCSYYFEDFSITGNIYKDTYLCSNEFETEVVEISPRRVDMAPFVKSDVQSTIGRLKNALDFWIKAGACENILEVIRHGYRIPFLDLPSSAVFKNNKSARENQKIVTAEIEKLINKGCVSVVSDRPIVVNPLTVAFNSANKARLVLDCRHINLFLCKFKFRLEDASVAREIFNQGDYLFSFDLTSAYHHVEIFNDHRTYLGFAWHYKGQYTYFQFNVLPFGIASAAYVFTKITRVAIKYWRTKGFRIVMYLDDGMGGDCTENDAARVSAEIQSVLVSFGFLITQQKCHWKPTQVMSWTGYTWNMISGSLSVSEKRMSKLQRALEITVHKVTSGLTAIRARALASLVGQIISMSAAMGAVVRLKTRYMYNCLVARLGWDSLVYVDHNALSEMFFWQKNMFSVNGRSLRETTICELIVYTDASNKGFGGYIKGNDESETIGAWHKVESGESSTLREMEALRRVILSNEKSLSGKAVSWRTDSKNAAAIVKQGSTKLDLQKLAIEIQNCCDRCDINLFPMWIPRNENQEADFLSRCSDSDDWQMRTWVFDSLDAIWGPHSVDRFASHFNTKCIRFNS